MIISHKHKFIFIKTMKTAGTSIETFLSTYCEGDDIVTFLGGKDEIIRRQMGVFPMNNLVPEYNIPDEKFADLNTPREIHKFRIKHKYHLHNKNFDRSRVLFGPHSSAKKVLNKITQSCWDDYYTFAFDRSPWERTMSFFYFVPINKNIKYATDEQVRDFVIKQSAKGKYFCNSRAYTDKSGNLIVKDLFDFSNLDQAMKTICERLGFDFDKFKSLPKFKGAFRIDRRPYEEILSDDTIKLIGDINATAIKFLGYIPKKSKL